MSIGESRFSAPLTVTVRDIREQSDGGAVALSVVLAAGDRSECRTLVIGVADYAVLKPRKGTVTEEDFEALEAAARVWGAMRCGEKLLAYGANTRLMLIRKIMRHGYSREEAETAAERLSGMGLIDEENDLRNQLFTRGFSRETMELLPEVLSEVDFAENCRRLIEKQYGGLPQDGDEERRMIACLYRYGYRMDDIRAAVRGLRRG